MRFETLSYPSARFIERYEIDGDLHLPSCSVCGSGLKNVVLVDEDGSEVAYGPDCFARAYPDIRTKKLKLSKLTKTFLNWTYVLTVGNGGDLPVLLNALDRGSIEWSDPRARKALPIRLERLTLTEDAIKAAKLKETDRAVLLGMVADLRERANVYLTR